MRYAMLLKPHPNARYRQSLEKLALIELESMLAAWNVPYTPPRVQALAGEPFLVFESDELKGEIWRALSRHSAICMAAQLLEGGLLRPVFREQGGFLPDDLPQVLKYKGKTNADFTYMLLHCAQAASAFARARGPLCVLDPMCGKATTLFCALCEGNNGVGVDVDRKDLLEAQGYFERSLRLHGVKHKRKEGSQTLSGGGNAQWVEYSAAEDAQAMREGRARVLRLFNGDCARLAEMLRPESVHLIVCDLPYGVQHAPHEGGRVSTLVRLVEGVLPGCERVLKPGGAIALAFNQNTLDRTAVIRAMNAAGLEALERPPYDDFSHWVEQSVQRDAVIARKKEKV